MSVSLFSSIAELITAFQKKEASPLEILNLHLQRAKNLHSRLNAFVHLDAENARKAATDLEKSAPLSAARPLHGIPVSIKSCIDVAGWACPAGSLLRKDYVPAQDAPLVARLKSAGAILLGNTNTPEFLMNYETNNLVSGKTSNPWDLAKSAGGSSGGESAAIASGCSVAGVGSDGGGSVRVPAHFCGICALKPTPGRVPSTGHFPAGAGAFSWLGAVGPMARTVADVRALFAVMAGSDPGDALSAPIASRNFSPQQLRGLRVGILQSDALGHATVETTAAVQKAAASLQHQSFAVELFPLHGLDRAIELWWFFFGPVIAHLFRQSFANLEVAREAEISPMFREYLALADQPSITPAITLDQFMSACAARDLLRAELIRQMRDVPILLSPVSTAPAFAHGQGTWRPGDPHCYRDTMRYSQWLNLAGFPGASVPLGFSGDGLPIGVQIIGRPHEDELVLAVAECIEQARGPWQAPPNLA
ncbi:MAG TPA: amidase [Candidatus Dormibacteraeota bacterium]|nr:amidase [Candidatus Dormibacteraeota bacterium]